MWFKHVLAILLAEQLEPFQIPESLAQVSSVPLPLVEVDRDAAAQLEGLGGRDLVSERILGDFLNIGLDLLQLGAGQGVEDGDVGVENVEGFGEMGHAKGAHLLVEIAVGLESEDVVGLFLGGGCAGGMVGSALGLGDIYLLGRGRFCFRAGFTTDHATSACERWPQSAVDCCPRSPGTSSC